jgi:hypothetical protein
MSTEKEKTMADDLEYMMPVVEGEGPSPEFVARLRAQIVSETEATTPRSTDDADHFGDSGDNLVDIRSVTRPDRRPAMRRGPLLGWAAAAAVLVAGLVVVNQRDNDSVEGHDQPIETTPATMLPAPAIFVVDAAPLPDEPSPLEEGTYRVDAAGTPFTFTTDEPLFVQRITNSEVVLTHSESQGIGDREIVVMRVTSLLDPTQPIAFPNDNRVDWPADDLGGWFDNLVNEIVVSDRVETTLGGLDATRFDLQLGATGCTPADEVCALFATNLSVYGKPLNAGALYQVWMVDQGEQAPLGVIVSIDREGDSAWFDTAAELLSTLTFGEIGPNPILAGPSVNAELPFLGGIQINLPTGSYAVRTPAGFDRVVSEGWPVDTKFLTDVRDLDGNALDTSDAVVTALQRQGADVSEVAPVTIGGVAARVFDVSGSSPEPARLLTSDIDGGWQLSPQGRIWVVDHPERGLLIITGEAYENLDITRQLVVAETQAIIASLAFVELG